MNLTLHLQCSDNFMFLCIVYYRTKSCQVCWQSLSWKYYRDEKKYYSLRVENTTRIKNQALVKKKEIMHENVIEERLKMKSYYRIIIELIYLNANTFLLHT